MTDQYKHDYQLWRPTLERIMEVLDDGDVHTESELREAVELWRPDAPFQKVLVWLHKKKGYTERVGWNKWQKSEAA